MIKVYYNADHRLHNPDFELYDGLETEYAEKAERLTAILQGVESLGIRPVSVKYNIPFKLLEKIHDSKYISFIKNKSASVNDRRQIIPSYYIEDTYTPLTRHTYNVAMHSVGVALHGAKKILQDPHVRVYSLCRPPGHHAEEKAMGGYCYFNNASVAAELLSEKGKVAILDLDYHHGNGTQQAFYTRNDVMYVSLHANPESAYPYSTGFEDERGEGDGVGYNINIPLNTSVDDRGYLQALDKAMAKIREFEPDFVVVSMGYDTFELDPIGGMCLTSDVYFEIGSIISSVDSPLLIIQEGGYNLEWLGELTRKFVKGIMESA